MKVFYRLKTLAFCAAFGAASWAGASDCGDALRARRTFRSSVARPSSPVKVAILDADDTLRTSKSRPGAAFVDHVDDISILPGVPERLRELKAAGYLTVIMSNQGGIPKYRTFEDVDGVFHATLELLDQASGPIDYYDFAEAFDENRKPKQGMITRLEENLRRHFGADLEIDRDKSFVVGDAAWMATETRPDGRPGVDRSNSDRLFAENAGLGFHYAIEFFAKPFGTEVAPEK